MFSAPPETPTGSETISAQIIKSSPWQLRQAGRARRLLARLTDNGKPARTMSASVKVAYAAPPGGRHPQIFTNRKSADLFDHLVGNGQQRRRYYQAERLCGFEVDDELKFGWLLDRQLAGSGAFENFVHILGSAAIHVPWT